jgi:hypothetical protein
MRWYSLSAGSCREGWVYAIIKKEGGMYQIKFGKDQTGWVIRSISKGDLYIFTL